MIEIKNLTKKIDQNIILNNINFSVKKGEVLGFLGPNGAGKTTTMKIITSFWLPTSGTITINGIDVTKDSLATRKRIGYLPETVPLYEEMKVFEYLKFVAEIRGLSDHKTKKRIKEVNELCGLTKVICQPIEELSKGYRQRLGLAQAIIHEPDILILDEPTTGLDPNQIVEIRNLIKKIGKEKTIIFSTHILSEVSATCDRIIIINRGKIVGQGSSADLAAKVGAKEMIYVKIKGSKDAVFNKLKSIEGVLSIEIKDKEAENIYGYEIESKVGIDLRELLSTTVINNNWGILEFNKKLIDLEDVFKKLTK